MNDNRALYNHLAENYDLRQQNPSTELLKKKEARLIKKYSTGLILDLGCGTGCHLGLSENVVGLDMSEKMLKIAKMRGKQLIQGDIENLPIKTNSLDTVLCFYSTLNLVGLGKATKEISRVLKFNGVSIVSPTSANDIDKKSAKKNRKTKKFRLEGKRVRMELYSKKEVVDQFCKKGFKLVKFDSIFRFQKPKWGNFIEFSLPEKIKLKLDKMFPREWGRIYFFVFEKQHQLQHDIHSEHNP